MFITKKKLNKITNKLYKLEYDVKDINNRLTFLSEELHIKKKSSQKKILNEDSSK